MQLEIENMERAELAAAAARFAYTEEAELSDALIDMIADMMHLCDREEISFARAFTWAKLNYEAER
jgi:hypothetical protein